MGHQLRLCQPLQNHRGLHSDSSYRNGNTPESLHIYENSMKSPSANCRIELNVTKSTHIEPNLRVGVVPPAHAQSGPAVPPNLQILVPDQYQFDIVDDSSNLHTINSKN